MKKILAVVLALVMVFGMVACAGNKGDSTKIPCSGMMRVMSI
jgi:uncharacterized lipoprotein YehR (DUF1307 family)